MSIHCCLNHRFNFASRTCSRSRSFSAFSSQLAPRSKLLLAATLKQKQTCFPTWTMYISRCKIFLRALIALQFRADYLLQLTTYNRLTLLNTSDFSSKINKLIYQLCVTFPDQFQIQREYY